MGADFILGTDPDSDRVGIMVRGADGKFIPVTGNQTGVLLLDYLIGAMRRAGKMPEKPVVPQDHRHHGDGAQGRRLRHRPRPPWSEGQQPELIDAKGGVIMPAFINAHTHIYSALARGLSIVGNNPTNFYEVLDGTWWAIDRHLMMDGTRASATALYMDSIKQGVTTIFDHHASYGEIPGTAPYHCREESRAWVYAPACATRSATGTARKSACRPSRKTPDFITECQQRKDPMLAAMFGGHALFTISDKTFDRMVAANNGRTGYHIHVSEGMNDVYDSLQNYGRRPVQRLQDHGILGPKTILGHCIHVNTAEMEIIQGDRHHGGEQSRIQHGQRHRHLPGAAALQAGHPTGHGHRRLHQRYAGIPQGGALLPAEPELPAQRRLVRGHGYALQEQRQDRREVLPRSAGRIEGRAAADIIVMDYKPFTPFSDENIDGHMIFGMTGRQCQTTIAAGKLLMQDRQLVGIDEEAENAHILEASKKLWGDLNHRAY